MSSWADRIGVFDLETTGVDVEDARIVTACIAVLDAGGDVIERWDWLADPGIEIPEGASAIHGVTTEVARRDGRPSALVVAEITQTLRTLFSLGIPVVVYNAPYDLSLLDRECRRNELEPITDPEPIIDPLVLDKAVDRYRKGKRTLEVAAAHYGVALDDAHDAGADAIAAGRVAQALVRVHADLDIDVADLHGRQAVWYAEQAARFQDYIRRQKGDESFTASTAWPIKLPVHPNAYRDTQPIPPLEPRLGRVPVLDFSRPLGLQLAPPPAPHGAIDAAPPRAEDAVSIDVPEANAPNPATANAPADSPEPVRRRRSPQPRVAERTGTRPDVLRIAAAIVNDRAGRTLLVRKAGTTRFMQPGGKIEEGESAMEALSRELAEEIGVDLDASGAEYLGLFRAVAANEEHTVVLAAVFAMTIDTEVAAGNEIEELLWVSDPEVDLAGREVAPLTTDELLPLWERRREQQSAR